MNGGNNQVSGSRYQDERLGFFVKRN